MTIIEHVAKDGNYILHNKHGCGNLFIHKIQLISVNSLRPSDAYMRQ